MDLSLVDPAQGGGVVSDPEQAAQGGGPDVATISSTSGSWARCWLYGPPGDDAQPSPAHGAPPTPRWTRSTAPWLACHALRAALVSEIAYRTMQCRPGTGCSPDAGAHREPRRQHAAGSGPPADEPWARTSTGIVAGVQEWPDADRDPHRREPLGGSRGGRRRHGRSPALATWLTARRWADKRAGGAS